MERWEKKEWIKKENRKIPGTRVKNQRFRIALTICTTVEEAESIIKEIRDEWEKG